MWLGAAIFTLLIFGAFASLFVTCNPIVPAMVLGAAAIGGVVAFIRRRNGAWHSNLTPCRPLGTHPRRRRQPRRRGARSVLRLRHHRPRGADAEAPSLE